MDKALWAFRARMVVLALMWSVQACGTASPTEPADTRKSDVPTETVLTALLSQVEGDDVTVVERAASGKQLTRFAVAGQVLSSGTRIRVPAGAKALVVCSSDRSVELAGEVDWELTEAACDHGIELQAGTYREYGPQGGETEIGLDQIRLMLERMHAGP